MVNPFVVAVMNAFKGKLPKPVKPPVRDGDKPAPKDKR